MKQTVATALAVIDGADEPLTPSEIGDRILVPSASITSTLDNLERRGWVRRVPNPDDRRSLLIEITDEDRAIADQLLPGIRRVERNQSPVDPVPFVRCLCHCSVWRTAVNERVGRRRPQERRGPAGGGGG